MKVVNTVCHLCSVVCGMRAYVEKGKLVRVEGIPNHIASNGGLCTRGLCAVDHEYDPKRLTKPLQKVGEREKDKWREISWKKALDMVAEKLTQFKKEYGAESVGWYRGTAPGWGSSWSYVKRFMTLYGSPNIISHDHLCYTPRLIGHVYTCGYMPMPDYENTNLIVLWGFNPSETNIPVVCRRIFNAVDRGAKLAVIDPRFTGIAAKADLFIQPRPGTDGALALGMLNYITRQGLYDREFVDKYGYGFDRFQELVKRYPLEKVSEITWVPTEKIQEVATLYATTHPAIIQADNGIEAHTNVVQTTRAISALQAITGNLNVPGGNISPPDVEGRDMSLLEKLQQAVKEMDMKSISKHPLYYSFWGISTPELLDSIETGKPYPIKALIVQGGSIITVSSNSPKVKDTLKKLDFITVHDQFMTATARIADLVLPASTFLEHSEVRVEPASNPNIYTQIFVLADKVVEPLGQCWSDAKLIFELARKLGYEEDFPWKDENEAIDYEFEPLGLTVDELRKHPEGIGIKLDINKLYRKHESEGFGTASKKVEFYSDTFAKYGYDPLPEYHEPAESPYSTPELATEYPLVCGTGIKMSQFTHTRYRTIPSLNAIHPHPFVEINPKTAKELGVKEGNWVFVESPRGKIKVKAKLSWGQHPKVVMVAHGWGQPYAHGQPANILTDDKPQCPISAATSNRSFLCRIYRE